jgi:hypothetical protein
MFRVAGYAWTRTMFSRMRMAVIVNFIVEMMHWGPSRFSTLLAVFIQEYRLGRVRLGNQIAATSTQSNRS